MQEKLDNVVHFGVILEEAIPLCETQSYFTVPTHKLCSMVIGCVCVGGAPKFLPIAVHTTQCRAFLIGSDQ